MVDRPTIADLAHKAGVSVATVDRVINRRLPVKSDTAQRVISAAEAIGFHAAGLLKKRVAELPKRRIGLLLQKRDMFYQAFGRALLSAANQNHEMEAKPVLEFMDEISPDYVSSRLLEIAPRVDALAVVAMEHPTVIQALEKIAERKRPVFSLLSPILHMACSGHLGIDARKIGRIAGWTVSRLAKKPGKICILVGSHGYINQDMSEISFRGYMREHAPTFELLEPIVNFDDSNIAYEAVSETIARHDNLVAVYVCGGGQDGLIKALRECAPEGRPIAVCNELTPNIRQALMDGIVDLALATPVETLSRQLMGQIAKACAMQGALHFPPVYTPPDIYLAENI